MAHDMPVVFVVDVDVPAPESLDLLIRSAGWRPETLESAKEFLARPRAHIPNCLVLDVKLPGLNGLELQKQGSEAWNSALRPLTAAPGQLRDGLTLPIQRFR